VLEADAAAKSLLDSYGVYKQRASLQVEGDAHVAGRFRVALARATSRPANDFSGLVIDAEYLPAGDPAAAAAALAELGLLLAEAAEAAVPAAALHPVGEEHGRYGLAGAHGTQHLAVQLVQLMHDARQGERPPG
jgi:hypothetical protein